MTLYLGARMGRRVELRGVAWDGRVRGGARDALLGVSYVGRHRGRNLEAVAGNWGLRGIVLLRDGTVYR